MNINDKEEKGFLGIMFDEGLKKNYLKIISNIYLINLSKMQEIFLSEYSSEINDSTFHQTLQILEEIYDRNLKITVKNVLNYFKITNSNVSIHDKTYIQIYIHYLSPYDPQRIKSEKLISFYSEILHKIASKHKYRLLVFTEPSNELINFGRILSSIEPLMLLDR